MRNFLLSLGVTGAVVGVAIYHAVKTNQENQREMEEEEERRKKAAAKFRDYDSVLMSCQLEIVIQNEGIGRQDIRVTAVVGKLKNITNDEIMHKIFSFCEVSDLFRIREVCKNWKEYIDAMLKDKNYLRQCANAGFNSKHRGKYWLLMSRCGISATLEKAFMSSISRSSQVEKDAIKVQEIERDISRTLVRNFQIEVDEKKQAVLKNTLVKYCAYDDRVGYVQGMNFLVGKIIRHMNENEAFSFLRTLMFEYDLRSLYFKNLPRMQIHLYQLDFFIGQYLPKLHQHFMKLKLKLGMFASEWFLTIFTYNFPDYFSDRIWDMFLMDGWPFLLAISVAILGKNQRELLKSSFEKCLRILKKVHVSEAETESLIERAYVMNIKFADLDLLHRNFIDNKLYLRI